LGELAALLTERALSTKKLCFFVEEEQPTKQAKS